MIYVLENPKSVGRATTDSLQYDPHNVGDAPRCPSCNDFIGMLQWLPPHRVELEIWGAAYGDIVFGPGDSLLVSERFVSRWQDDGLLGLEGFDPVEVVRVRRRRKIRHEPPRYFRVSVVRSEVAIDQERSGFEWEEPPTCPVCRVGNDLKKWNRIMLGGPPTENILIARGLNTILVDERFRQFCEEHGIENVCLIPGSESRYRDPRWYRD